MNDECFATLIAGPTASGKSALAIRLAKACDGIVVNADSMQVYADLTILSARPTQEEQGRVPHHLFGFVSADEEYSVGRFVDDVASLIENARQVGRKIVLVGGTGLYFRALVEGLVPTPAIPDSIRAEWLGRAHAGHDLHAELMRRDPVRAAQLHSADTPRLLRAIELHAASGKPYSQWLSENPGTPLLKPGEWRGIFLNPQREVLRERIDRRFLLMMEQGALEEVEALMQRVPPLFPNRGVMKAHGVPHLAAYLRGQISREEAIARGQTDTRAYARRQVIFARKYLPDTVWNWSENAGEA